MAKTEVESLQEQITSLSYLVADLLVRLGTLENKDKEVKMCTCGVNDGCCKCS